MKEIQKFIDVDSFVDWYLIHELYKDPDSNLSSNHMTIRGTGTNSRLHKGPLWDFDLSAGNAYFMGNLWYHRGGNNSPQGHWVAHNHAWFYTLVRHVPEFRALAAVRLAEIQPEINAMFAWLEHMAQIHATEFARNFRRWNILTNYVWPNPSYIVAIHTHVGHVQQVINFLKDRNIWMTEFLNSPM